jgi:hypothetical protein
MKKQIEITEKATRVIEFDTPAFFTNYGTHVAITDHSLIRIWTDSGLISIIPATEKTRYANEVAELLKDKYRSAITRQEFETAFNNTIKCLTEQYQLSMNMMDPNAQVAPANQEAIQQQAEGQEVAATESAAQDNAMEVTESAEEGSTEG